MLTLETFRQVFALPMDAEHRRHTAMAAEETPVGLIYNGFPHAVMMATALDLEDFAVGFSRTEGLIAAPNDMSDCEISADDRGIEINITLAGPSLKRFLNRRRTRNLRGHTSCGVCGIEDIDQLATAPHVAPARSGVPHVPAIHRAAAALRSMQPLSRMTRCAHAAAWCDLAGTLILTREDVGRHNALDKLIGACMRRGIERSSGFCVITSRCSFEMVQKAAAAGMATLVSVSAPTALAVRTADEAGITLIALGRDDAPAIYTSN